MREGFFNLSELSISNTTSTISRCGLCGLNRGCISPKMPPTGKGRKGILICAEAAGHVEDQEGEQLIGEAGQLLRGILKGLDVKLDKDCWKTNCVICRPPKNKTPSAKQIESCRPNLMNTIKKLKPHTIILLGASAIKSLIPIVWKDDVGNGVSKWVGWNIPSQKLNTWICPTYHPSYLLRTKNDLLESIVRKHLRQAFTHTERPWKEVPDYKKDVEIITRPSQAAKAIRAIKSNSVIAFDYETNCIKCENIGSEIICCSICINGKNTFSYPWSGEAVDATAELLKSDVPKVGANIKFEDRWTRRKLGFAVRGWYWDTMLASHILDNRSGITSVKFQSFVRLGLEGYDLHIKPYFKSDEKTRLNRIKELPINDLLLYNAMDSLVEYKIYILQKKEMKRMHTEG